MNTKDQDRKVYSELDPIVRASMRRVYSCMRRVSGMTPAAARSYVMWAARLANLEAILRGTNNA